MILDYAKEWIKKLKKKKQGLYEDLVNFHRFNAITETLNHLSMDICKILRIYTCGEYNNKDFIVKLNGVSLDRKEVEGPPRKRRKL